MSKPHPFLLILIVCFPLTLLAQGGGVSFRVNGLYGHQIYQSPDRSEYIQNLTQMGYDEHRYGVQIGLYNQGEISHAGIAVEILTHTMRNPRNQWSTYTTVSPTISSLMFANRTYSGFYAIIDFGGIAMYEDDSGPSQPVLSYGGAGAGGVGVMIPLMHRFSLDVNARYHVRYWFETSEVLHAITFGAGIQF